MDKRCFLKGLTSSLVMSPTIVSAHHYTDQTEREAVFRNYMHNKIWDSYTNFWIDGKQVQFTRLVTRVGHYTHGRPPQNNLDLAGMAYDVTMYHSNGLVHEETFHNTHYGAHVVLSNNGHIKQLSSWIYIRRLRIDGQFIIERNTMDQMLLRLINISDVHFIESDGNPPF